MTKKKKLICDICGNEFPISKLIEVNVFNTPYSRKPKTLKICSKKCQNNLTDIYMRCNECGRWITNLDGNRKRNFEITNDGYPVCWKCYEKLDFE